MTKKQIIEKLAPYPDDMDVFIAERKTDFTYGLVNSVTCKEINFMEDPDDNKALASGKVIILDEE